MKRVVIFLLCISTHLWGREFDEPDNYFELSFSELMNINVISSTRKTETTFQCSGGRILKELKR